jgi:3-oxoacyl-[acyl-carrier-protein] synthase-3
MIGHGAGSVGVAIAGVGAEIPTRVVTSAEIEARLDLPVRLRSAPGWLERATGIRERRWADPDVRPSALAIAAARKALAATDVDPGEIDAVLFGGITRDFFDPATANVVAEAIGARRARVFDLISACNGIIEGIDLGDALIRQGRARRVLVTSGERASITVNWHPQTQAELLRSLAGMTVGDGGGAVLLEATDDPARGIRATEFRYDTSQWRLAVGGLLRDSSEACAHCGSPIDFRFTSNGRRLFVAALPLIRETLDAVIERSAWTYDDVGLVFCHLASKRYLEKGMRHLGEVAKIVPKMWTTVERFGNTSTFGLPLAMAEAQEAGALTPGTRVLMVGVASGISVGAVTAVW